MKTIFLAENINCHLNYGCLVWVEAGMQQRSRRIPSIKTSVATTQRIDARKVQILYLKSQNLI